MLEDEIKQFFEKKMPFLHIKEETFGYDNDPATITQDIRLDPRKNEIDKNRYHAIFQNIIAQNEAFYLLIYDGLSDCLKKSLKKYRQNHRLVPGIYDWLGPIDPDYYLCCYSFLKKDFDVTVFLDFLEKSYSSAFLLVDIKQQTAIYSYWKYGFTVIANTENELNDYLKLIE